MRISSIVTYILPFTVLILASLFITFDYFGSFLFRFFDDNNAEALYISTGLICIALSAVLFFLFRKQVLRFGYPYFGYLLLALPLVLEVICALFTHNGVHFKLPVWSGLFLFFSYKLFVNRYVATLTEDSIHYKNLLGQEGIIALTSVTKVEEKKNLLTFFRDLRFLGISQKLGVAFCDENLDEYEINIYLRVYYRHEIFAKIIDRSNKCGNLKIRQYSL